MMNISRIKILFIICFVCYEQILLGAEPRTRLVDPIIPKGIGWGVDSRKGCLTMGIPLGGVSGPIPIPVVYRVNGSYQEQVNKGTQGIWDASSNSVIQVPCLNIGSRPVYGTIHFGYISIEGTYTVGPEPTAYVIEDGTSFLDNDLVPMSNFGTASQFTLPTKFNLITVDTANVKATVDASYATYATTLAGLGQWKSAVQATLPVGFGPDPGNYRVIMDKNIARIYARALYTWVPILWLDRFGHFVSFKWTKINDNYVVEAIDSFGKGVQVQWGGADKGQEVLVNFIGIKTASAYIQAQGWMGGRPVNANLPTNPYMNTEVIGQSIAGPVGRPKLIIRGDRAQLPTPIWLSSGKSLPVIPSSDSTVSVDPMQWTFEWDSTMSEITAFTEPSGVRTVLTYSYLGPEVPYDGSTYCSRMVYLAESTDLLLPVKRSQLWSGFFPGNLAFKSQHKDTFGSLDTAFMVETIYEDDPNSIHCRNGAPKTINVKDASGKILSTTNYTLGAMGVYPSYSRVETAITTGGSQKGVMDRGISYVTDPLGVQNLGVYEGYGETNFNYRYTENKYEGDAQSLDLRRVVSTQTTDLYGADGAGLKLVTDYNSDGMLPVRVYRTDGSQSEGKTFTYDTDGRVVSVEPYPSSNKAWKTTNVYQAGGWPLVSTIQNYQEAGDVSGAYSGSLTSTTTSIDTAYRPCVSIDARGVSGNAIYDLFGRVRVTKTEGGGEIDYDYSSDGRTTTITKTIGSNNGSIIKVVTSQTVDGFGRKIKEVMANGSRMEYSYDDKGRLEKSQAYSSLGTPGNSTETIYDDYSRPEFVKLPNGSLLSLGYTCYADREMVAKKIVIKNADGNGSKIREVQESRNPKGELVEVLDQDGVRTSYGYKNGKVVSVMVSDPASHRQQRSYTYDAFGRMLTSSDPETNTIQRTYNALGLPATLTEASGRVRTFTYDGLGRVLSVTTNRGSDSIQNTYQGMDLVSSTTVTVGKSVTKKFEYTGPGKRLTFEGCEQPDLQSSIRYGYDEWGKLIHTTYPSKRVLTYGYDDLGGVNRIWMNGTGANPTSGTSSGMVMDQVLPGAAVLSQGGLR